MAKPFLYIYLFFSRHRSIFYGVLVLLFAATGFFALKIKPEEDISRILPGDRVAEKMTDILQNARFADKLVVMVSLKDSSISDPDSLSAYAETLTASIKTRFPTYVRAIDEGISDTLVPPLLDLVFDHLPLYLEPEDYKLIDSLQSPVRLKELLEKDIRTLASPAGLVLGKYIRQDPLGISSPAFKKVRRLQYDENFELYNGHVITKDGKQLLLFISPAFTSDNTGKNTVLLEGLDHAIAELQQSGFASVRAEYFGGLAVAAGNAAQLRKDSILTLSITALFLITFISWYFKRKRAPFLILLPVALGALFSLSLIYFIQGTISVIALAAGSVVLGIAINYSLHVYNHFLHRQNMKAVLEELSFPLTIGGLTTIGGFLCLQFVQSDILKDLGLFAAFSLIGASLGSLIILPQLISSNRSGASENHYTERDTWIRRVANWRPEKNRNLVWVIFGLTIIFGFFMKRVSFDQDMMHMNFMPDKLKSAERNLNQLSTLSLRSMYLVVDGNNLEQALRKQEQAAKTIGTLQETGVVKKSTGVFEILISDSLQKVRLDFWNQYWKKKGTGSLFEQLKSTGQPLGFRASAFEPAEQMITKNYQPLSDAETGFIRNGFADDYIIEKNQQVSLVGLLKVDPSERSSVYAAFKGSGDATVLDRQYMTSRLVDVVTADFGRIGWMTGVLVFFVLLLTYGRLELALVSFIPMVIAFIWILGFMGITGITFNIVNIILSALIFGLGDDYSLFIMDGLLQEYKTGRKNLSSYKSSIVLSAITTLAGLGVLIFARHPALRSIAMISIAGILSVVIIAQVLIPFFFHFLITNRIQKGYFPWTASGLFKSIFSLCYFAIGSWVVTVIGYLMVKWNPAAGPRARYLFHRILSRFNWSVLYIMGNVKKKIINPQAEDFSKPCVMIANHQSFLDILVMTMLHPKVILLTNNWVWNSPVFGRLVRIAGYYPIAKGIENSIGYLEEQVKAGFSIAVFPEGTRSPDEQITRFHKGAFYIAEKLDLDILPVLIHGTGYTMSKSDFLLKDGFVTIQYLPRVKTGDLFFGVDYSERAKFLGRYFRKQYVQLKATMEQPRFFREKLIYNYIYKGPVLEWYLRVKIRLENDYQLFHDLLPKKGRILDIGCGYGFMTYMLQFVAPERDLIGYDYDEEKIETASHCFSRNENIHFQTADINQLQPGYADAIILSDVLHYLLPEHQELLLQKCIGALRPKGVLLIRDGDRDLKKQHERTRMTEFFSTRFFVFNKTAGHALHFLSGNTIRDLAKLHRMECRVVDQSKHTSNKLFLITHPAETYEKV